MFYALLLSFSQYSTTKTFLVIKPQPEFVLKFGKFEPRCSYKVSCSVINKKACTGEQINIIERLASSTDARKPVEHSRLHLA